MPSKLKIIQYYIKSKYFARKASERDYNRQIKYIRKHSQFYKDKTELPLMDKNLMMENFDALNTVGVNKETAMNFAVECEKTRDFSKKLNGVTVGLSSGTSGHRGIFLVSDREQAMWAGTILAKALPKGRIRGHKVAFFMRANSELYETIHSKTIEFKFFDMYNKIEENMHMLKDFQPSILVAPPSMLLKIAELLSGQIFPVKVISIAEVLEQTDAEIIKDRLKQEIVHQIYQCTEGFLGITCEHGTLHLNEDIFKIEKESIDGNRFYPIISDLKRRAQPIMRYRLNDILVERKNLCPCGSKFIAIEKIEGRQDDIFIFKNGDKDVDVFPDFIRRCILFVKDVGEYCVVQTSAEEINIFVANLTEDIKNEITTEFRKLSEDHVFNMPTLNFMIYEYDFSRKLKRIEKSKNYAKG